MIPFRYLKNHSSSDLFEFDEEEFPWNTSYHPRPEFGSKGAYSRWCKDSDTDHIFFTAVEAMDPHHRVNKDNPAKAIYGFVGDYDAETPMAEFLQRAVKLKVPVRPYAASLTYSGNLRVVWKFEEPINLEDPHTVKGIMKRLATRLNVTKVAAGFDDCSLDVSQLWEIGSDWHIVPGAKSIPQAITRMVYTKAVKAAKRPATSLLDIPMEEIAAQLREDYPGRLDGFRFELNARVPLFWLPITGDGKENDKSAFVSEAGVYSHSTRADQQFMPWRDLLSREFLQGYEERRDDAALDGAYYDGRDIYISDGSDGWLNMNENAFSRFLRGYRGLSRRPVADEEMSSVETALMRLQTEKRFRVKGIAPFPHLNIPLVVDQDGGKMLNSHARTLVTQPAATGDPDDFPWLHEYFTNFLHRPEGCDSHPRELFYAGLQRAYSSFLSGVPTSGHANILGGQAGVGKSLLTLFILSRMFGGGCDAGKFFTGGTSFTSGLAESPIWYVDDAIFNSFAGQRRQFSETLKKFAASPRFTHEEKFEKAHDVSWYGRIYITCNEDVLSTQILPDLDMSSRDKFNFFRMNPDWVPDFPPNAVLEARILKEMPHFLKWLIDYEPDIPFAWRDGGSERYGLKSYHDPFLLEAHDELSEVTPMREALVLFMTRYGKDWEGTSSQLMMDFEEHELGSLLPSNATHMGRMMAQVQRDEDCDYITSHYSGKQRVKRISYQGILQRFPTT